MIGLMLFMLYYFVRVCYKQDVKAHVTSKYCCTWRGFKDYEVGRVNIPCHIVYEDVDIIGGN